MGLAAVSVLALSGCVQPQPAYPQPEPQLYVGSAQGWSDIARSVVEQLAGALPPGARRVVYLETPSDPNAAFYDAFTAQLTTEFVKKGIAVSHDPAEPYQAKIEVVRLRHHNPSELPLVPAIVATAASLVIPIPMTPDTEIVVTTQLTHGALVVAASSGTFYINPGEYRQYRQPSDPFGPVEPVPLVSSR